MNYRKHEPSLHATPVLDLRPTQMTIGMSEVARKRESWKSQGAESLSEFLAHHMVPVVFGPGGRRYLIDHHHLARALHDEGVDSVFVSIVADFHKLDASAFWNIMDFHGWTHPFDGKGAGASRRPAQDRGRHGGRPLPLARRRAALRRRLRQGLTPFSEFVWADFLRRRVKPKDVRKDFGAAIDKALGAGEVGGRELPAGLVRPPRPQGGPQAGQARQTGRRQADNIAKSKAGGRTCNGAAG